jgi:NTE family protein
MRRASLGLALGGGGARGYAHIGVLRVLDGAGIPVNYLAGASMGGLIAAGYATGMTADRMEAEARSLTMRGLLDISLPRTGLLEGRRVHESLVRLFGNRTFADTRIPLSLVAVDLNTGEEITLSEGRLADAVRATISVPGIFVPVERDGRLLVDGGILNNVPADIVRRMGAEVIIAVDVMPQTFQPLHLPSESRRLSLPGLSRLSSLLGTMVRSIEVMDAEMSRLRLAQAQPDLIIRPQLGDLFIEQLERAGDAIPPGERAAEAALPTIRKLTARRLRFGAAA